MYRDSRDILELSISESSTTIPRAETQSYFFPAKRHNRPYENCRPV